MCAVSMIGDHYAEKWQPRIPQWQPTPNVVTLPPDISRAEFDALKAEVEEMKSLLKRAKAYDEATGQPDCEMDDKVALLKQVAKMVGIDLSEVLPQAARAEGEK